MPSSLAAALAASKKSPAVAVAAKPAKKKADPPRPSSLMQYQKNKAVKSEEKVMATNSPHRKRGKHDNTKNDSNRGKDNNDNPNHKKTPNNQNSNDKATNKKGKKKGGKASTPATDHIAMEPIVFVCDIPSEDNIVNPNHKKTPNNQHSNDKATNKKGKKKGGKAPTPAKTDHIAMEPIVFVCDIPSDSDDSDYDDECNGDDGDYYVDVDGGFDADDLVDGADEEGEISEADDLDLDVVVIVDGDVKKNTHIPSKGDRHGKGHGGDKGARSGRDNRNDQGNKSGGRGRGRGAPVQRNNAGRGNDRNGGRDLRSGNTTRGHTINERDNVKSRSNPGAKPTPWSTRAQPVTNNDQHSHNKDQRSRDNRVCAQAMRNDQGSHNHDQRSRDNRDIAQALRNDQDSRNNKNQRSRDNRAHVGQHSRQNMPSSTAKHPTTASKPASTLINSGPPPQLESAAIKGRWADEDSSDDE